MAGIASSEAAASGPVRGFFSGLVAILWLRLTLHLRRRASRGGLALLGALLVPFAAGYLSLQVAILAAGWASSSSPTSVTLVAGLVFGVIHILILTEVVALVGRGEGMASALHVFPLSPALIYFSELLGSSFTPAVLLAAATTAGFALKFGGPPILGALWAVMGLLYLMGMRRMLQLLLASLLRRRFLREMALAAMSAGGLGLYFGVNWLIQRLGRSGGGIHPDGSSVYWWLPHNWFVTPFSGAEISSAVQLASLGGGLVLTTAVFAVGYDLQIRAMFGEAPELLGRSSARRRGLLFGLIDRLPLAVVPAPLLASANKELRVLWRDPYMMVMLVTQSAVLLALPYFFFEDVTTPGGGVYPYLFSYFLVMGQTRLAFNSLGSEGRGLRFLAQSPVSRWQVLMGKNLAYAFVFLLINGLSLWVCAEMFERTDLFARYAGLNLAGLLVLLGVGNFASVWIPIPWIGARAAAGGHRAVASAADGGVERPGCGALFLRGLLIQAVPLLLAPVFALGALAPRFLDGPWLFMAWIPILAWVLLIYVVSTGLALHRLEQAEERLLTLLASRYAA